MDFLRRMLTGRYGNDALNKTLVTLGILLLFVEWITRWKWISLFILLLLGVSYFRMLSRNIPARYAENQKFIQWFGPALQKLRNATARFADRKTHKYYKCPNCRQRLRVPKGRGKINITCPHCHTQFVKKT